MPGLVAVQSSNGGKRVERGSSSSNSSSRRRRRRRRGTGCCGLARITHAGNKEHVTTDDPGHGFTADIASARETTRNTESKRAWINRV